jgi:CNT family concentrative nucleoside transporter
MKKLWRVVPERAFRILAWAVFLFCGGVIATGVIVGSVDESAAQDPGTAPAASEEVAEEVVEEDAAAIADENRRDLEQLQRRAESAESLTLQLISREAVENGAKVAGAVQEQATAVAEEVSKKRTLESLQADETSVWEKAISFLGIFALIGVAWLLSTRRESVNWKLVGIGVGLQLAFALLIFYVPGGQAVFEAATTAVKKLLDFTSDGSEFIFRSYVTGQWEPALINFAFSVLPTIIFFSSLMTILYHLGVMQKIVYFFALGMQKLMDTSGAETLSAAANIFVGQTEAPLVVKPYVDDMTMSELMVVMTGGFATVAGGVLAIYVGMLESTFPDIAGHLLAASVMSAPAALVVAKVMYPEVDEPVTRGELEMDAESEDTNVLDAASRGAAEGLKLALNVGAMLLAFIALISLVNYLLGLPSLLWNKHALGELAKFYAEKGLAIPDGCTVAAVADDAVAGCVATMKAAAGAPDVWQAPMITMQEIFGYLFWPFAWIMGVPTEDCFHIAQLLGEKMVVNELVAYSSLSNMLANPDIQLQGRSVVIATYALCGFANFGSIGIQLGGIGGIAPDRKHDLATIALRAMIGGTLAAFMTATVAGILV